MKNFVDSKWLIENIDKEDLVIIDATAALSDPLEGERTYKEGHIKGSHFVSLEEVMAGDIKEHGGRHPLPDLDKFIDDMRSIGVNDSSKVVIYDDGTIAMAGRLWWLLKYIGKKDIYILKGGKEEFIKEGGEISKEKPTVEKLGDLSLDIDKSMKVDMDYVKGKTDDKNTAIVDARAYERYIGEVEPLDSIPGHIKNAINHPWAELLKDSDVIDLEYIEKELGYLKKYDEVLVHCGSGITGTVVLLFLEEIGINSVLYAGGYSDWLSYDENEVIQEEN